VPSIKIRDIRAGTLRAPGAVIASVTIPIDLTVAGRPGQDLSQEMIRSILKQTGLAKKDLP